MYELIPNFSSETMEAEYSYYIFEELKEKLSTLDFRPRGKKLLKIKTK